MNRYLYIFIIGFFLVFFPKNLQANSLEQYTKTSKDFYLLYEESDFRKFEHNWLNTISKFENIAKKYPNSLEAPKSFYNIGALYGSLFKWNKKAKYIKSSIEYFKKLVDKYPKNYLADDSLLKIIIYYSQKDQTLSNKYLKNLVTHYPKSPLIEEAKKYSNSIVPKKAQKITPKNKKEKVTTNIISSGKSQSTKKTAGKAIIKNLEYFTTSNWTRVILTVNKKIPYKYQALKADPKLKKPPRFYIDLQESILPKDFKKKVVSNNGIIRKLRIAQFNPQVTRLAIDLYTLNQINVFATDLDKESKIIIDISGEEVTPQWSSILSDLKKDLAQSQEKINLREVLSLKINRIIIDPGHGGKDPGAVGPNNYYEKKVVLKLSQILKKDLSKKLANSQIFLTRTDDKFISLESRAAFANSKKGDLFISIHANSFKNARASGIETYYLSLTKDQDSLTLAARENSSTLKNISDLQAILNDLINHTKVPESKKLATVVQRSIITKLRSKYKTKNLGVKKAPFLVLIGSQMPSVLIEIGFISNQREKNLLSNTKYLQSLSEGISSGVVEYISSVN